MLKLIKSVGRKVIESLGYEVRLPLGSDFYQHDSLVTNHNHDFMLDPTFKDAYAKILFAADGIDPRTYWRCHVAIQLATWAASRQLGDFVECGVDRGSTSQAILATLKSRGLHIPNYYLFDTFDGLDPSQVPIEEQEYWGESAQVHRNRLIESTYKTGWNFDKVRSSFSGYKNVYVFKGRVPEVLNEALSQNDTQRVAFIHIDMNNSVPEVAAMNFFKNRFVDGAIILLDDYAYQGYGFQKKAMDEWASIHGKYILSLPTGQGLLIWH